MRLPGKRFYQAVHTVHELIAKAALLQCLLLVFVFSKDVGHSGIDDFFFYGISISVIIIPSSCQSGFWKPRDWSLLGSSSSFLWLASSLLLLFLSLGSSLLMSFLSCEGLCIPRCVKARDNMRRKGAAKSRPRTE
jgi:hypothetical protein